MSDLSTENAVHKISVFYSINRDKDPSFSFIFTLIPNNPEILVLNLPTPPQISVLTPRSPCSQLTGVHTRGSTNQRISLFYRKPLREDPSSQLTGVHTRGSVEL
jgi:hypothetical protein